MKVLLGDKHSSKKLENVLKGRILWKSEKSRYFHVLHAYITLLHALVGTNKKLVYLGIKTFFLYFQLIQNSLCFLFTQVPPSKKYLVLFFTTICNQHGAGTVMGAFSY